MDHLTNMPHETDTGAKGTAPPWSRLEQRANTHRDRDGRNSGEDVAEDLRIALQGLRNLVLEIGITDGRPDLVEQGKRGSDSAEHIAPQDGGRLAANGPNLAPESVSLGVELLKDRNPMQKRAQQKRIAGDQAGHGQHNKKDVA